MMYSFIQLYVFWLGLGNVPVDYDGLIEEDWSAGETVFKAGTDREEIWHWFESANPLFLVHQVQGTSGREYQLEYALGNGARGKLDFRMPVGMEDRIYEVVMDHDKLALHLDLVANAVAMTISADSFCSHPPMHEKFMRTHV